MPRKCTIFAHDSSIDIISDIIKRTEFSETKVEALVVPCGCGLNPASAAHQWDTAMARAMKRILNKIIGFVIVKMRPSIVFQIVQSFRRHATGAPHVGPVRTHE